MEGLRGTPHIETLQEIEEAIRLASDGLGTLKHPKGARAAF